MNKLLKIMGVREEPDCICYDFAVGGGRDIEQQGFVLIKNLGVKNIN